MPFPKPVSPTDTSKPPEQMSAAEKQSVAQKVAPDPVPGTSVSTKVPVKKPGKKVIRINTNAENDFNAVQADRERRARQANDLRGDIDAQIKIHMAKFRPAK